MQRVLVVAAFALYGIGQCVSQLFGFAHFMSEMRDDKLIGQIKYSD